MNSLYTGCPRNDLGACNITKKFGKHNFLCLSLQKEMKNCKFKNFWKPWNFPPETGHAKCCTSHAKRMKGKLHHSGASHMRINLHRLVSYKKTDVLSFIADVSVLFSTVNMTPPFFFLRPYALTFKSEIYLAFYVTVICMVVKSDSEDECISLITKNYNHTDIEFFNFNLSFKTYNLYY
jgi:hypothetical protein